jgi:hypothetical protein
MPYARRRTRRPQRAGRSVRYFPLEGLSGVE